MATFPAFLDTCTLFGAYLCDTLLRLAEAGTYRPLWSAGVLDELERNLVERGLAKEAVSYRIREMSRSFPDAAVHGYETLTESMTCDRKDRHVLAAAVRGDAEVLVTFNTSDFPDTATSVYDITVVHPDDFLLDQLDLYPGATVAALRGQARRPPSSPGPAGVRHPEDQTAPEDITPHPQLGALLTQPGQLGPLIRAQLTAASLPPPPVRTDPVPQRALIDTQLPGHPRDRLPGLPDQPHRALPEVLIELPPHLCHRHSPS